MLEVPAGHTATGVARLGAASQALVMAALALEATRAVLTLVRAHLKEEDGEKERGARRLISGLTQKQSSVFILALAIKTFITIKRSRRQQNPAVKVAAERWFALIRSHV